MSIDFQSKQTVDEAVDGWLRQASFDELKSACQANDPPNPIVCNVGKKAKDAYQRSLEETKAAIEKKYINHQRKIDESQSAEDRAMAIMDQELMAITQGRLSKLIKEQVDYARSFELVSSKHQAIELQLSQAQSEKTMIDANLVKHREIQALQRNIDELQEAMINHQREITAASGEIEAITPRLRTLVDDCKSAESELSRVEGTLQRFGQEFDSAERSLRSLEQEESRLNNRLRSTENDLLELSRLRGELQKQNTSYHTHRNIQTHAHIHLHSPLSRPPQPRVEVYKTPLPYSPTNVFTRGRFDLEGRIAALERKYPNYQTEKQTIRDQISSVQSRLQLQRRYVDVSNQQMQDYKRDCVNRVREQCRGLANQLTAQQETLSRLEFRLSNERGKLMEKGERLTSIQSELRRLQSNFLNGTGFDVYQNEVKATALSQAIYELQCKKNIVERECDEYRSNRDRCIREERDLQQVFVDVAGREKARELRTLEMAARAHAFSNQDLTYQLSSDVYLEYCAELEREQQILRTEFAAIQDEIMHYFTAQLLVDAIHAAVYNNKQIFEENVSHALESVFKLLEQKNVVQRQMDQHEQHARQAYSIFQDELLNFSQQAEREMLAESARVLEVTNAERISSTNALSNDFAKLSQVAQKSRLVCRKLEEEISCNSNQQQKLRGSIQVKEQAIRRDLEIYQKSMEVFSTRIMRGCLLVLGGIASGLLAGAWFPASALAIALATVVISAVGAVIALNAYLKRRNEQASFRSETSDSSKELRDYQEKLKNYGNDYQRLKQSLHQQQRQLASEQTVVHQKELEFIQAKSLVVLKGGNIAAKAASFFEHRVSPCFFEEHRQSAIMQSQNLAGEQIAIRQSMQALQSQIETIMPSPGI